MTSVLVKGRGYMNQSKSILLMVLVLPLKMEGEKNTFLSFLSRVEAKIRGLKVMTTYYLRELYQKQHHRRSRRFPTQRTEKWRRHTCLCDLGEAKREGVWRPHASLRGIQWRLSVQKVPVAPAVHIWAGRRSVTEHSVLFAEKKVSKSNTRLASASGSAFLRNWKLSKFH